jgi:hypothetical protein
MKKMVEAAFVRMDTDKNQTIDQEELKEFLEFLSEKTET